MKVNGNAPQTRRRLLLLNEDAPICLTAPRLSTLPRLSCHGMLAAIVAARPQRGLGQFQTVRAP